MKGLMKVCSSDSAMWREWRGIGSPREYVGECTGSRSVGRPWKIWIDTVKACLKKKGLDIRQARRIVQDRSEWQRFVKWNEWGVAQGMTADLNEMPHLWVATAI